MANVTLDEGDLHSLAARISAQVVEQLKTAGMYQEQRANNGTQVNKPVQPAYDPNAAKQEDGRKGSQAPALA